MASLYFVMVLLAILIPCSLRVFMSLSSERMA